MARHGRSARTTVADMCRVFDQIAPLQLAQDWDNVGLLAGDESSPVRRVLLCIDLSAPVVDEALAGKVDLVMAYHPPLFRPISRLHGHGRGTDAHVFRCVAGGVAIYSLHTALDAAEGGTNDVLAGLCGVKQHRPMEYAAAGPARCKVVVFVPAESADRVAEAMFEAGAGHIGEYDRCSYRLAGEGTFRGSDATNPTIGQAGQFERVAELRIESVAPKTAVPAIVEAIRTSHPYEEPAFDVYPLEPETAKGAGRVGDLPKPMTLAALARKLKRATDSPCPQIVGRANSEVRRVVVCVGAAGSMPFRLPVGEGDVVVTGEIRHHDALTIQRHGATAIALGHWSSERPALVPLAERIIEQSAGLEVHVSQADAEPFTAV